MFSLKAEYLKQEWCNLAHKDLDFFQTFDFHHISYKNDEGSPILFVVRDDTNNNLFAWPFLERQIPKSNFKDLTSVYGYSGPIVFSKNNSLVSKGYDFLFQQLSKTGYVTCFSRLHPILLTEDFLPPNSEALGKIVYIDCKEQRENPLDTYKKQYRYEIRKTLKNGVEIYIDKDCSKLSSFISIYHETMQELRSKNYYLFNEAYFNSLVNSDDFKVIIIFAQYEEKDVAASMFVISDDLMQYYLSGSLRRYRKLAASKAIIAKAHELAIEFGVSKLILGGGVGSKEDGLFKFKSGFSDKTAQYYIFKKILNERIYQTLCEDKGVNPDKINFFPAYRA